MSLSGVLLLFLLLLGVRVLVGKVWDSMMDKNKEEKDKED